MSASLDGTLPDLQTAFAQLSQYAQTQGITINVADFGGFRTLGDTTTILADRQNDFTAAVNAGQIAADTTLNAFRPVAPYGHSYHNYGAAFDVRIDARPSGMTEYQAESVLGAYAPRIGLTWGGTFTNPDPPHFQLAVPLATAEAMYFASGVAVPPDETDDVFSRSTNSSLLIGLLVCGLLAWAIKRKFE